MNDLMEQKDTLAQKLDVSFTNKDDARHPLPIGTS